MPLRNAFLQTVVGGHAKVGHHFLVGAEIARRKHNGLVGAIAMVGSGGIYAHHTRHGIAVLLQINTLPIEDELQIGQLSERGKNRLVNLGHIVLVAHAPLHRARPELLTGNLIEHVLVTWPVRDGHGLQKLRRHLLEEPVHGLAAPRRVLHDKRGVGGILAAHHPVVEELHGINLGHTVILQILGIQVPDVVADDGVILLLERLQQNNAFAALLGGATAVAVPAWPAPITTMSATVSSTMASSATDSGATRHELVSAASATVPVSDKASLEVCCAGAHPKPVAATAPSIPVATEPLRKSLLLICAISLPPFSAGFTMTAV